MYVVTGDEMHQIDRYTMDHIGLNEETLMENAGQAFVRHFSLILTGRETITVLIGAGNNGGDGFVIARLLKEKGFDTEAWVIPPVNRIKGTARKHMEIYTQCGYTFHSYEKEQAVFYEKAGQGGVIIDALLGTGIKGDLKPPYKEIIKRVNASESQVISVDIPSGLPSSEGAEVNEAVRADYTITLQAPKLTSYLYPEADFFGELHIVDIGIPEKAFKEVAPSRKLITEEQVKCTLAGRETSAHKGKAGRALVIGGSLSMTGAPVLTGEACLRAGAGLVTLGVPESIHPIVAQKMTEAMFRRLSEDQGEITEKALYKDMDLSQFNGLALGPGLGRGNHLPLFKHLHSFEGPLVIDADGLFHMTEELSDWAANPRPDPTVITPHPGEMARLTGLTVKEVEKRRFEVAREFAAAYNVYVVLKGPFTIVSSPDGSQWVNTTGNAALAKGGSGDVLTGIILAFLLQPHSAIHALCNAVYIHGKLADKILETHDLFSVNASDLIQMLPKVIRSSRY